MLRKLIEAGVNVARLNFSHGTHQQYAQVIRNIRSICAELDTAVAIMQDLQGPKIRTGRLQDGGPVQLKSGQPFTITTRPVTGNSGRVSTSYAGLPRDVRAGDRVLLSDGAIELVVRQTTDAEIQSEVLAGGTLAENQGINVPGVMISAPPLAEKDLKDLEFGLEHKVDFIALSFVRRASDVRSLKEKLAKASADIPVIAKLEKPQAIENLDEILDISEGVMVARGDLGVEMSPEKVPVIQKDIITKANRWGKLVITATQMLESMINNPRPTRAEASDVANAVFDGSDAVMLSGETARGQYPIESVRMMVKIITESEKVEPRSHLTEDDQYLTNLTFPEAVCDAAYHASRVIRANAIIAFTQTGATAKLISKYRPSTDIIAFTPHAHIVSRMCLYWGVKPMCMHEITNVDELIRALEKILLDRKIVKRNDNLIILTGAPIMEKGHTSLMKLHHVGG